MDGREEARKQKYVQQILGSILKAQKLNKDIKVNDGIGALMDSSLFTCELTCHTLTD